MSELVNEAAALRRWLFEAALPLWLQTGVDRCRGRFHEAIGLDGSVQVQSRRAGTIARMAFSCCEAGRPGWLV